MNVWSIRGKIIRLFCAVLCTIVVHNDMHTLEQFLQLNVGLWFSFFVCLFRFSILCFPVLASTVVFLFYMLLLCWV